MEDQPNKLNKIVNRIKRKESIFALGMIAGSVVTIVVLGKNPIVMTMTAEQAQKLIDDPKSFVLIEKLGRTFATCVVAPVA